MPASYLDEHFGVDSSNLVDGDLVILMTLSDDFICLILCSFGHLIGVETLEGNGIYIFLDSTLYCCSSN